MDGRGGEETLGGVKGGKTVTRIYCMRKESIFNKKGEGRSGTRTQTHKLTY